MQQSDRSPAAPDLIPRNLLREVVFTRLLTGILRGDFRVGQRLRLESIAAELQVSRTPVREALVALENHRMVHVHPYVGVVIAPWSVADMIERVEIICGLLRDAEDGSPEYVLSRIDPLRDDESGSEGGTFAALAEWVLRAWDRPIGAEWVAAQRPVLDVFYRDDIAVVHGIDISAGWSLRGAQLSDARAAAAAGDPPGVSRALRAYATELGELQAAFRPRVRRLRARSPI